MSDSFAPAQPRRADFAAGGQSLNPYASGVQSSVPSGGGGALISVEQQRAVAEVQARMIIARSNPRNPIRSVESILNECTRPTLAAQALYQYSRGGSSISGPSIKLAETMARHWGNIASGIKEVSRAAGYSECVAYAWDLETGFYDERQFQVKHWRDTKGGGYLLTDERDIYELIANMGQRRKRAVLLTVIPGDVQDAAVEACEATLSATADTSPDALRKMVGAFGAWGVTQAQIEKRCQCRLEAIRPAQVVMLSKIYASLRDEMSKPADWFEDVPPGADAGAAQQQKPADDKPATEQKPAQTRAPRQPKPSPESKPAAGTPPTQEEPPPPAGEHDAGTGTAPPPAAAAPEEPAQQVQQQPQSEPEPVQGPVYWLSDEVGEASADSPFSDAVAAVQAYSKMWMASPNRIALANENADVLLDLAQASKRAADMLESLAAMDQQPDEQPQQQEQQQPAGGGASANNQLDPAMWRINVPQGEGGRPNLPAYTAQARTSLASITSEAMLVQWIALNGPTYGPMPRAVKVAIETAINDRRSSWGGAPAAAQSPAATDADARAAQARLGDIAACATPEGLLELDRVTQAQTNRWQRERPELFEMVRDAAKARMAALKGARS